MDVCLSRSSLPDRGSDPHDWNTWDHYRSIHENRTENHWFVECNTLEFDQSEPAYIHLAGKVYCKRNVILNVEKTLETTHTGGVLKVRGSSYLYVAWIARGGDAQPTKVLRYHNIHERDYDYHHRVFDPLTGEATGYEKLERYQFPTLSEVIDEIEIITRVLDSTSSKP